MQGLLKGASDSFGFPFMLNQILSSFPTLQFWTRSFAGLTLILLALSPIGCDSSGTGTGSTIQTAANEPQNANLEKDSIATQELAKIEYKLRDLNTITQRDGLVLEELRKKFPDNDRILNCLLKLSIVLME